MNEVIFSVVVAIILTKIALRPEIREIKTITSSEIKMKYFDGHQQELKLTTAAPDINNWMDTEIKQERLKLTPLMVIEINHAADFVNVSFETKNSVFIETHERLNQP